MKEKIKKVLNRLWKFKYLAVSVAFLIWMIFFDRQNYFYRTKLDKEMESLVKDTLYYDREIKEAGRQLDKLTGDRKALEKLGREKYLMKKDDEDVFIIVNEAENQN